MTSKIEWAAATDVGLIRDHNEDAYFVNEELSIGFVADGMGGHAAGEVASAIAVAKFDEWTRDGMDLPDALEEAHKAILIHPQGGGRRGMGTTGVGLRVRGSQAQVAWVGDSRGYLYDGNQLIPLTKDHTPVQDMVDAGLLTREAARHHPRRNEISQALGVGMGGRVKPDNAMAYFGAGSVILLCSDGLTEHLSDEQLLDIFRKGTRDLSQTLNRLIQAALDEGGSDNITVVLAKALA